MVERAYERQLSFELETHAFVLTMEVPGLSMKRARELVLFLQRHAASKCAASAAASGVQLTTWRHGYRTGLAQAAELLRRRQDLGGPDTDTVGDAIRTLQGWIADSP